MHQTITNSHRLGAFALSGLLLVAASAKAQQPLSQGATNYTSGNRNTVGPAISPDGAYYPGSGYSLANRGSHGASAYSQQDSTRSWSGIFFTSINYPGIYGMYSMGITPQELGYKLAPEVYPHAPAGMGTSRLLNAVTDDTGRDALTARIDVRLPENAELWFNGLRTTQAGPHRFFISPPLRDTRASTYEVRAQWPEGGQMVVQSRDVRVHRGERVTVEFPLPEEEHKMIPQYPSTGK